MINMDYKFNSYSRLIESQKKEDIRYDWCVFLDEDEKTLRKIDYIKYVLHPTYSNPEKIVNNPKEKFALYSSGLGSFNILIEVFTKDKKIIKTNYFLKLLDDNWPIKEFDIINLDEKLKEVYTAISDSDFKWRKRSTIFKKANIPLDQIENSINKLEELNLIRKNFFKSFDNQDLYGITARVGRKPE